MYTKKLEVQKSLDEIKTGSLGLYHIVNLMLLMKPRPNQLLSKEWKMLDPTLNSIHSEESTDAYLTDSEQEDEDPEMLVSDQWLQILRRTYEEDTILGPNRPNISEINIVIKFKSMNDKINRLCKPVKERILFALLNRNEQTMQTILNNRAE